MNATPRRILAIKLADIGDLLLITPALRALRRSYPEAVIDALATPNAAPVLQNAVASPDGPAGEALLNHLWVLDKHAFDRPRQVLRVGGWGALLRLARHLRRQHYDTVILFHHFSLRFGVLKHAALALATGAPQRIGLDNGRGFFLTERVPDGGFGAQHELDYWLALAEAAGAQPVSRQVEMVVSDADHTQAAAWLPPDPRPTVALHPGSGGYSLARRWDLSRFVELGQRLGATARLVVVGRPADQADRLAVALGEHAVNLCGRTSLSELAAVLQRCDLLVGADSGVLHLAAAVNTPTAALFGPTNHHAWAPALPAGRLAVVRSGAACSPCAYTHRGLGSPNGCPEQTCMHMIGVEQVETAARALLTGRADTVVEAETAPPPDRPMALNVLGVPVHPLTFDSLLEWIEAQIGRGPAHQLATVNPEFIMAAQRDPIFQVVLMRAALCLPDGVGLLWASRWLCRGKRPGEPLPERVTGSDGVPLIAERAVQRGWRVFFLGAAEGIAEQTADLLGRRYPGLQVAGCYAGSPTAEEEDAIVERVNQANTDILFVAYGAPRQDKWIARNLPRLNVSIAMGVGGSFDFITGHVRRAPRWMQRLGLEWLYRLLRQPWRWRRMLALPRFALAVFWQGLR